MTSEERYGERDSRLWLSICRLQVQGLVLLNRQRKILAGTFSGKTSRDTLSSTKAGWLAPSQPASYRPSASPLDSEYRETYLLRALPGLPPRTGSARLRCWDGSGQKKGQYAVVTVVARDLK
jgi:hypothetical protein